MLHIEGSACIRGKEVKDSRNVEIERRKPKNYINVGTLTFVGTKNEYNPVFPPLKAPVELVCKSGVNALEYNDVHYITEVQSVSFRVWHADNK